jgi:hypothetical protein
MAIFPKVILTEKSGNAADGSWTCMQAAHADAARSVAVCVCVCVRERERSKEREVCVCV